MLHYTCWSVLSSWEIGGVYYKCGIVHILLQAYIHYRYLYVTWSRGMSRMSGMLILSYRLKEVINSHVLHCFWLKRIVHISATRCSIEMGFESRCSILNRQVIYIEKAKLKIADMWLIPLDRVTYLFWLMYFTSNVDVDATHNIFVWL